MTSGKSNSAFGTLGGNVLNTNSSQFDSSTSTGNEEQKLNSLHKMNIKSNLSPEDLNLVEKVYDLDK